MTSPVFLKPSSSAETPSPAAVLNLLVPLAPNIKFSKYPLAQPILEYILCPYPLREDHPELYEALLELKDARRLKLFRAVASVTYADATPGSTHVHWTLLSPDHSKLDILDGTVLHVNDSLGWNVSVRVKASKLGTLVFLPDLSSLEVGHGSFLLPVNGRWEMTPTKVEKKDSLQLHFNVVVYDPNPSRRLLLLKFMKIVGTTHKFMHIPMIVDIANPNKIAYERLSDSFTNSRQIFPSMLHGTLTGTPFYKADETSKWISDEKEVRTLYGHKHLAKVVAFQQAADNPQRCSYLFETSHVNLRQWLENPWPLLECDADLIEVSKIQLLTQCAEALEYIIVTNKKMHGYVSLDSVLINSNYEAKLLWNCNWPPVPPTQAQLSANPSTVRILPCYIQVFRIILSTTWY